MKRCPVTGEYAECALDCDQQCLAALTDLVTYKGRPPELYRKEYVAANAAAVTRDRRPPDVKCWLRAENMQSRRGTTP